MIVKTSKGLFGPFATIYPLGDFLMCDDVDLYLSVIGSDYTVIDSDPPGPADRYDWDGKQFVELPMPDAEFEALKSTLAAQIDAAVLAVYARPVSLAREYELRLADAEAFRDAGFSGQVGRVLNGYASCAGLTARQAAEEVLSLAAGFQNAELELADLRMEKFRINSSTTATAANSIFNEALAAIQAIGAAIA